MVRVTARPSPEDVAAAVALPPLANSAAIGSSWLEHFAAPREDLLSVLISEALQYPESTVHGLIRFGAVYTCPIIPPVPEERLKEMPIEKQEEFERRRKEAMAGPGGKNTALRTPRRFTTDAVVPEHSYIRVHCLPKRFPAYHQVSWSRRVIADGPDFVVMNKPGGVPVAPTVDNLLESTLAGAALALGLTAPLRITNRLDQVTEGLVVLGKTAEFVQRYNALVRGEKGGISVGARKSASAAGKGLAGTSQDDAPPALRKFYRAATAAPPPVGRLIHHMAVDCKAEQLPRHTLVLAALDPGTVVAELVVVDVQPVELTPAAAAQWGHPAGAPAYEAFIELVTGRTHQIRAQLGAVGCPLLGDHLYAPLVSPELRRRLYERDPGLHPVDAQGRRLLQEPTGPIALQAGRLVVGVSGVVGEGNPEFEAGPPWWREDPMP